MDLALGGENRIGNMHEEGGEGLLMKVYSLFFSHCHGTSLRSLLFHRKVWIKRSSELKAEVYSPIILLVLNVTLKVCGMSVEKMFQGRFSAGQTLDVPCERAIF